MLLQGLVDIEVPGVKFLMHRPKFCLDFMLGQGQSATQDGGDALGIRGDKGANDDPGALRAQHDLVTFHAEIHAGGLMGWERRCSE